MIRTFLFPTNDMKMMMGGEGGGGDTSRASQSE